MQVRHLLLAFACSVGWAQSVYRTEFSLSQAQRIYDGGSPALYEHGRVTTMGFAGLWAYRPTQALRLRFERSIAVPDLPAYDATRPFVRRDKAF